MAERPDILLFDIIETVFSLEALRDPLARTSLPASDLETLFATALRDAFALASAGGYAAFPDLLDAALGELLAKRGVAADADQRRAVIDAMKRLQLHPDARPAFELARERGIEIHALSNGSALATEALLEAAGLRSFMSGVHSVELVRSYKPNPVVYRTVCEAIGHKAARVMLVATHAWDCHGATAAGLEAGFVSRGRAFPAYFRAPTVQGDDLVDTVGKALGSR